MVCFELFLRKLLLREAGLRAGLREEEEGGHPPLIPFDGFPQPLPLASSSVNPPCVIRWQALDPRLPYHHRGESVFTFASLLTPMWPPPKTHHHRTSACPSRLQPMY